MTETDSSRPGSAAVPGRRSPVTGLSRWAPALAVPFVWITALYLVPLAVGLAVGAEPLRLVSSGILFDQLAVTLNGYRLLVWSPVATGILLSLVAHRRAPTAFEMAMSLIGATLAGTLLLAGGALGVGPGSTLLVGTELRWVWRMVIGAAGLAIGLVAPVMLRAHAEDHDLDFVAIRKWMLRGGLIATLVMLLLGPGPVLGRAITGGGSWLGSLVWILAL